MQDIYIATVNFSYVFNVYNWIDIITNSIYSYAGKKYLGTLCVDGHTTENWWLKEVTGQPKCEKSLSFYCLSILLRIIKCKDTLCLCQGKLHSEAGSLWAVTGQVMAGTCEVPVVPKTALAIDCSLAPSLIPFKWRTIWLIFMTHSSTLLVSLILVL